MLRKQRERKLRIESFEQRQMMSVTPITIAREAEDMTIVSGFKAHDRDGASGGEYVSATANNQGEVRASESIAVAGSYTFSVTVKAPDVARNSLAFSIDGGPRQTWEFPIGNKYATYTWPTRFNLSAGSHTIQVFGGDQKTQFDKYELNLATPTVPPVDPDPTDPPPTDPPPTNPPTGTLDPTKTPGQNFDLSRWKLTLPVNSSGGLSGISKEIQPAQLRTYTDTYFRTAADGAMQFTTPVIGAKTSSGTSYTRTELRELNADGSLAAWAVAQGGTMTATVAINQMPVASSGIARVVIGQIHGPDDELTRLYYDANGKLYYGNDKSTGGRELFFDLKSASGAVTNIPLGARFDYKIEVAAGRLTVSAVYNGVTYSASETINSFWNGKALYFKAGLYLGVGAPGSGAGTTGSGTGMASFYALRVVH